MIILSKFFSLFCFDAIPQSIIVNCPLLDNVIFFHLISL